MMEFPQILTPILDLWIEVRLSGGWRRSGHKIWVQVSILSITPALAGGDGRHTDARSAAFRQLADDKLNHGRVIQAGRLCARIPFVSKAPYGRSLS